MNKNLYPNKDCILEEETTLSVKMIVCQNVSATKRVKQGRGIARRKGLVILNSEVREGLLKSDIWTRIRSRGRSTLCGSWRRKVLEFVFDLSCPDLISCDTLARR